jgi:hypothetical protein
MYILIQKSMDRIGAPVIPNSNNPNILNRKRHLLKKTAVTCLIGAPCVYLITKGDTLDDFKNRDLKSMEVFNAEHFESENNQDSKNKEEE